jgi:hypothetical protein
MIKLPPTEYLYNVLWTNQGLSLRTIGKKYNTSRDTIHKRITSMYGKHACSRKHNSFRRVISQEYGMEYADLINRASNIEGSFLTTAKENNMSKYYSVTYDNNIEYTDKDDEYDEPFNLKMFIYFTWAIEATMKAIYYQAVADRYASVLEDFDTNKPDLLYLNGIQETC